MQAPTTQPSERSPVLHAAMPPRRDAFWCHTPLSEMTRAQWESLCDGCGKCCLNKYEDEDDGSIHYTAVACRLLDLTRGCCADYAHRARRVPDCVLLSPETLENPGWLPETCAYRRLAEGRALPDWHPLVTGDPDSVRLAGHAVHERVYSEDDVDDPLLYLIDWVR